ncbi:MAG: hypothetical protein ACK42D_02955 [Candidatus Paceibacteria bacterium]
MLLRAIENVRQKPKAVRQRYAFVIAATFTAVVAGVWSLSLPSRFMEVQEGVIATSPQMTSQQPASVPFSGVWNEFKQQVLGMASKSTTTTSSQETYSIMSTSTPEDLEILNNDPVLLESGSTIRFGTQESSNDSPGVLIGTTSTSLPAE